MSLCKYSKIFGEPKKGLHSYRIANIAIVDLGLTAGAAFLLNKYVFKNTSAILIFIGLMVIAIIAHRMFCVRTTIDKLLFKD
jgi:hypothetical protein